MWEVEIIQMSLQKMKENNKEKVKLCAEEWRNSLYLHQGY